MRTVLGLTGIRSDYFLARPIFRAIEEHSNLDFKLIVAGAHLTSLHGRTGRLIEEDGFDIVERIDNLLQSDRDASRLIGAVLQLQVLSHVVDRVRPDWLLAVGDREEPLGLSVCGAYLGLPVAHYAAGDRVVGNVDDTVRHAISRLSHLLLTTNEQAAQRLVRAGEQEERVHFVGHAGVDRLRTTPEMPNRQLAQILGVDRLEEDSILVIQHPLSSKIEKAGEHMLETLEGVTALDSQVFVGYPNSDPGSQAIIDVIQEFRDRSSVHVFRNLDDQKFVALLRRVGVLVGNSSLGILEAPYLKLPVVNVGKRQTKRQQGGNVVFVDPDRAEIEATVSKIIEPGSELRRRLTNCDNPYGDGRTGPRVADLLAEIPIDREFMNKDLTY